MLAAELKERYPRLLCHTANSAATLRGPRAHFDMVRTGIAMYGLGPANDDPFKYDLRPAMKLESYMAACESWRRAKRRLRPHVLRRSSGDRVGIVPMGYADGVRRALTNRGEVLVAGRRCRIIGTHQHGPDHRALARRRGQPGDEVVLFGAAAGDGAAGEPPRPGRRRRPAAGSA